jgi:hypothetical protein
LSIVTSIPTAVAPEAWQRGAARWIQDALNFEHVQRYTTDDVLAAVMAEKFALWIAFDPNNRADPIDAAMITEIRQYPQLREYCTVWIGGRRLWSWAREFDRMITEAARSHGCRMMVGLGRPGWRRFGYKQDGAVMQRDLAQ